MNKAILAKKILEQIENTNLKENIEPTLDSRKPDNVKPKYQKSQENTEPEGEHKPCNCRKSKCLKLYCECFANNKYCGPACACSCCNNTPNHDKIRLQVKQQILMRNPLAFRSKLEQASDEEKVSEDLNPTHDGASTQEKRHFKGCNCRRSNCQKKYCECFQQGVPCTDLCKCDDCLNGKCDPS